MYRPKQLSWYLCVVGLKSISVTPAALHRSQIMSMHMCTPLNLYFLSVIKHHLIPSLPSNKQAVRTIKRTFHERHVFYWCRLHGLTCMHHCLHELFIHAYGLSICLVEVCHLCDTVVSVVPMLHLIQWESLVLVLHKDHNHIRSYKGCQDIICRMDISLIRFKMNSIVFPRHPYPSYKSIMIRSWGLDLGGGKFHSPSPKQKHPLTNLII